MVILTKKGLGDKGWEATGVDTTVKNKLEEMVSAAKENPTWAHIAPSNLFIAQIAPIAQQLGLGIVGLETHDPENVDRIYTPHNNLRLRVVMPPTGENRMDVIGSVVDVLYADPSKGKDWAEARRYAMYDSLQLITVTCTEKGYNIDNEIAAGDMERGPNNPQHVMAKVAALAYDRLCFCKGKPIAFVSMDNCSRNGEKFKEAVLKIARAWSNGGLIDSNVDLPRYLETEVSFPWTMIDRITPRPSQEVSEQLTKMGIEGMEIIETGKHTFVSPFANTEHISYLVMQDAFPNGRPQFEKTDSQPDNRVIMVPDIETVDLVERMKVGACLNPLHTTLAVSGVILGYDSIASMMQDPLMSNWVRKQAYDEALPKVKDPRVLVPKVFLDQIVNERLPNAKLGDTPQRIATDTSQKIAPRFSGTIKAYGAEAHSLIYIPLAITMWCRYLAGATENERDKDRNPVFYGIDDNMQPVKLSTDGDKNSMLSRLAQYTGQLDPRGNVTEDRIHNALAPILSDEKICGLNLYNVGLGQKIEGMVFEMLQGQGAVKRTIGKYVNR